ncbi:MAG: class I SAM-dependent methyltransferase [Planctomycetota bacterium]
MRTQRRLGKRLSTVASMVTGPTLADIGSDHGYLLEHLLLRQQIEFGIAIERNESPMLRSRQTLQHLSAEVRHADGLSGLEPGEADCISICGMGGELMVRILERYPEAISSHVVLQPNSHVDVIRKWMFEHQFELRDERVIHESRWYTILDYRYHPKACETAEDECYHGLSRELAFHLGPILMRRRDREWHEWMKSEAARLRAYPKLHPRSARWLHYLERGIASFA